MRINESVLVALLVVLVLIIIFQGARAEKKDGFCNDQHAREVYNRMAIDAREGVRLDAYNQPHVFDVTDIGEYYRQGANLTPENIEEAHRAAWFESLEPGTRREFNVEHAYSPGQDFTQYHTPGPVMDYNDYVADLALDKNTQERHRQWVEEVQPWSQTALKVDTINEAAVINLGLPRWGIRAFYPHLPNQENPLFITDINSIDSAPHFRRHTLV